MSSDSRFVPASPSYTVVKKPSPHEDGLPRMRWWQRWLTDHHLARPEIGAKTLSQAFRALFSPFGSPPDLVTLRYVREGDRQYAKPVENLVLAVRGLCAPGHKGAQQNMRRFPLFNIVVQTIREWDIETMNQELAVLQREPRSRTFADFVPVVVPLLRPLYRMIRLSPNVHILPALAKMYDSSKMYLTSRDERDILQRYYSIARDEVQPVFQQVRQKLYPVLLKLLSDRFLEMDQFFTEKEPEILAFLGIADTDLVLDLPEIIAPTLPDLPANRLDLDDDLEAGRPSELARHGLVLLDNLFPKSGWRHLEKNPDLFSYFQTIFEFPKGSDMIPVDDPIQVIQTLSEILQQLFYGFQNIQWGTTTNQAGEVIHLQEVFDKKIARWHFFHEEFFGKNYLPLLQEYCREVERAGPLSSEAKRREHQLLWFKRNYLLPHMILPVLDDVRVKSLGYPNLSVQIKEMLDLLSPIAVEIEQKGMRSTAILNPEARVKFPVSSMVSQRFQYVMRRTQTNEAGEKRYLDQGNNKALLFYAMAFLSALDDLVSRPGSLLQNRKPKHLYRTSGAPGDDKPVYNAAKKNSLFLLRNLNDQPPPDLAETPWQNKVGDLYGPLMAAEDLKARIHEHFSEKKPFVLVAYRAWTTESAASFRSFALPFLPPGSRLHPQDDGTWHHVMGDTLGEEAEILARRILEEAARRHPPLALGALIIPFATNWGLEKILSLPPQGWAAAAEIPTQVLGRWINSTMTFDFVTDVPTVSLVSTAAQAELRQAIPEEDDPTPIDTFPVAL